MDSSSDEECSKSTEMSGRFRRSLILRSPIQTRSGQTQYHQAAIDTHNLHSYLLDLCRQLRKDLSCEEYTELMNSSELFLIEQMDACLANNDDMNAEATDTEPDVDVTAFLEVSLLDSGARKSRETAESVPESPPPPLVSPSRWVYNTPKMRRRPRPTSNGATKYKAAIGVQNEVTSSREFYMLKCDGDNSGRLRNEGDCNELNGTFNWDIFNNSEDLFKEFNFSFEEFCAPETHDSPHQSTSTQIVEQDDIPEPSAKPSTSNNFTEHGNTSSDTENEKFKWYDNNIEELRKCLRDNLESEEESTIPKKKRKVTKRRRKKSKNYYKY